MRFAFIETEKAGFPVTLMCRMLAVSRAGFYAWRRRPAAARTREDRVLAVAVAAIYAEHHGRYGSPRVRMELRDRNIWLEEGEFLVVPRGVEHRPVAEQEAWVLLFEPASTLNTGNVQNERTLRELERV